MEGIQQKVILIKDYKIDEVEKIYKIEKSFISNIEDFHEPKIEK